MSILHPSLLMIVSLVGACAHVDPQDDRCAAQLRKLGVAINAYRRDRGGLPDRLSSLVPAYIPDSALLHCPEAQLEKAAGGEAVGIGSNASLGYSYEMRGVVFDGMASPPGPIPTSDLPGKAWGSERNINLWLRRYYGDRVPVARCPHHGSKIAPRVLNLTLDGDVYEGGPEWKADAGTVAELLRRAGHALAEDPSRFEREWRLSSLDDEAHGWTRAAESPSARLAMSQMMMALTREAPRLKDRATAYRLAARLALYTRDFAEAESAALRVLALPGKAEDEGARVSSWPRRSAAADGMPRRSPYSG